MNIIPQDQWRKLKQVIIEQWGQLTQDDLDATQRKTQEITNLIKSRIGLTLDEASHKLSELIDRIENFEAPHEVPKNKNRNKNDIIKRTPAPPANRDRKPKDKFHL